MIDALKEEEVVNKVGGRFKLSTLIQKRLVGLNAGSRPHGRTGRDRPGDRRGARVSRFSPNSSAWTASGAWAILKNLIFPCSSVGRASPPRRINRSVAGYGKTDPL